MIVKLDNNIKVQKMKRHGCHGNINNIFICLYIDSIRLLNFPGNDYIGLCPLSQAFFLSLPLENFLFRPELSRLPPCVPPEVDAILDTLNLKTSADVFKFCYAQKGCARDGTAPLSVFNINLVENEGYLKNCREPP